MKTIYLLPFLIVLLSCELEDMDEPGNLVPKTVTEDPMLPSIDVNGALLHAEAFGDINNPILLFLHGGPGGDYRPFISQYGVENASRYPDERSITNGGLSQLQDEYYCVFYDQRGAGLSERFDQGVIDTDMYVNDLDGVIDHYLEKKETETGITEQQVSIFAWSYGGILSTEYINSYPNKVKDIIFYEPGPFAKNVLDYLAENMTMILQQVGEVWLEEYLLSHDHITPDSHERGDYQFTLTNNGSQPEFHMDIKTPYWRFGSFVGAENLDYFTSDNYDITSNLGAFSGRSLFMGGQLTLNDLPKYMELQMEYYPGSQLVIIPMTGHTGVWEKPDEIADAVRAFLQ